METPHSSSSDVVCLAPVKRFAVYKYEREPEEKKAKIDEDAEFLKEVRDYLNTEDKIEVRDWTRLLNSTIEMNIVHQKIAMNKVSTFLNNPGYTIRCPNCTYAAPA
jgi:hypothetical protein